MFRPISWRKQAEKAERRTRYCELSEFSFSTARITTETKAGVISAAPHARFIATEPTSGKSTRNGCFWYTRRGYSPFGSWRSRLSRRSAESSRTCGSATATRSIRYTTSAKLIFLYDPTSRREHIRRVEKAPAMGAFGTLVGNRTRICGSGGHRSIRYTTSAELYLRNMIYYTSFGRGCQTTTARAKEKINAKKKARPPISAAAQIFFDFNRPSLCHAIRRFPPGSGSGL